MVVLIAVAAVVVGILAALGIQLPELKRYLKIRKM